MKILIFKYYIKKSSSTKKQKSIKINYKKKPNLILIIRQKINNNVYLFVLK